MTRVVYQIDAFTKTPFTGNPAGVVVNADGMSLAQMQMLARELNNSETAFVLSASGSDHDLHIRYFTPRTEVPICGHATIASGYALLRSKIEMPNPLRIKTGAGVITVAINNDNVDPKIEMIQGKIELGAPYDARTTEKIISALGLDSNDIDQRCPISSASTGHSKVMIGIRSKKVLDSLTPNLDMLKEISTHIKCNGYYVFTFDSVETGVLINGRMFAPAIGIDEDPVTGNANGPLGAYLVAHNLVEKSKSTFCFLAAQGEAIGRKGYVEVEVKIDSNGSPFEVKILGSAIEVFRTAIEI